MLKIQTIAENTFLIPENYRKFLKIYGKFLNTQKNLRIHKKVL